MLPVVVGFERYLTAAPSRCDPSVALATSCIAVASLDLGPTKIASLGNSCCPQHRWATVMATITASLMATTTARRRHWHDEQVTSERTCMDGRRQMAGAARHEFETAK